MKRFLDPTALLFIVILAFISITGGRFQSPQAWFIHTLMILPGIVIGLSFHEAAHAFSAYKLGDNTPKFQGRVTINGISIPQPGFKIDPNKDKVSVDGEPIKISTTNRIDNIFLFIISPPVFFYKLCKTKQ